MNFQNLILKNQEKFISFRKRANVFTQLNNPFSINIPKKIEPRIV